MLLAVNLVEHSAALRDHLFDEVRHSRIRDRTALAVLQISLLSVCDEEGLAPSGVFTEKKLCSVQISPIFYVDLNMNSHQRPS